MERMSTHLIAILAVFLVIPTAGGAAPIAFSASGADSSSIQATVDAFRSAIGGVNNGNGAGPLPDGRREINWDGGGAGAPVNTNMAHDLFKSNRGAFFGPDTTVFSISGAPNPEFGNINATYPDIFATFSSPRLFSPTNSNVTEMTFFVPGTNLAATSTAFGAVFTDVDLAATTSIEYLALDGASLGTFSVPTANNGLSFLGVQFDAGERIAMVRITTGNAILGPNDGDVDVVAMDDFVFAEPQAVPEPTTLLLLTTGLAGLLAWRRSRSVGEVN